MQAETTTTPSIDPSDIRSPSPAASRRTAALMGVGGAVAAAAIGFAAWTVFDRASAPRASSVRMGPVADMPEIRNGVPAMVAVRPAPARSASQDQRPGAPESSSEPRAVRTVSAPPPAPTPAPAPPAIEVEAANAKAMALTAASVSLRPGFAAPAAPSLAVAPASRSIVPDAPAPGSQARAEIPETPRAATSERTAGPADRPLPDARRPVPSVAMSDPAPADDVVVAPPVVPSSAQPETPSRPVPPSPPAVTARTSPAPLPPVRPAIRAAPAEQVAASARPRSPASGSATSPAPAATRIPAEPVPERAQIFGVPLPGFVPTGREIREAAGSLADAVVNLPERF